MIRAAIFLLMCSCTAIAAADSEGSASAPAPAITSHQGTFNGAKVRYRALVESTDVPDSHGRPAARLVSFAYLAEVRDASRRPVIFVFNGGPITASLWLHIGVMGPKRLAVPDDLAADARTIHLTDNAYSPLDVADLVFIDPASTGYSRVLPGTAPESYYSVASDGQQITAFISQWLESHGRSGSPVYMLGESYGTLRAAEVAAQLVELPHPIRPDGVILMGQAVNIIEYSQRPQNIISYAVSLPTLAALAWYHGKVERNGRTVEQFADDAWQFAQTDYLPALFKGSALEPAERARIAQRLEALSGISAKWYEAHGLRITKEQYRGELLKDRGLLLGRNDGRYVAPITDKGLAPDPFDIVMPAFTREFAAYLRNDLQVRRTDEYVQFAGAENLDQWNWGATTPFSDWPYGDRLKKAMEANPRFRVLIGNGYYDTQTSVGAAVLAARQGPWPAERVSVAFYEGGHLPYTIERTAKRLTDDVRAFVQGLPAGSSVAASTAGAPAASAPAAGTPPPAKALPSSPARRFESEHVGVFGGTRVRYKAIVAENFLTDAAGKRTASLVTTSYLRSGERSDSTRPVIFAFNGGPGSSSIWLHMGFAGPRRVDLDDSSRPATTPPFKVIDNPDSPLDVADIVLIDPPGTGFSRVLPDGKPEQFYGVTQDAQATADFIQQWVREHGRWNAPKFLLSESYGTVRAAVVARLLAGGPTSTGKMDGMTLNGIVMLGQAMDQSSSGGTDGNILAALPSLAATACFHGKITGTCTASSQAEAARSFAADAYVKALNAGTALSESERDAVATRLAALTGLTRETIRQHNLRIFPGTFARELLADQGKEVGLYDGRYTLPLRNNGGDPVADDPSMGQYVPGFVAAFDSYSRNELGVPAGERYEAIAFRDVNLRWDWGGGPGIPPTRNYAEDLATAMRRNPQLRLMIGTGYYDLVTPLGAAEYTLTHSGIPRDATEVHFYSSGHMPYLGANSRAALARDVRAFITQGVSTTAPATERLAILHNGEKVGAVVAETRGDTINVDYAVSDNGRGPKHRETLRLGADGIPVAWSVVGTSTAGAAVNEEFKWSNGRAAWKSQADQGDVEAATPPLYAVNDNSPWALGVYSSALLKAPGNKLPLLPSGTMSMTRVGAVALGEGTNAATVSLYRLAGINLAPDYVALDRQGRLFATLTGGLEIAIREGHESDAARLQALADEDVHAVARERARKLAHRFERPIRIRNVHVFDPRSGQLSDASDVVVMGEHIAAVAPFEAASAVPADEVIVDGEGGTLVPGLHDMHSHTTQESPLLDIAAGITATRDMGNLNSFLLDLRPRIDSGELIGPRITPNGFLEGRSPYSARVGRIADTLDDALRSVDWYADRGYFQIKIYNSMNPDWVKPIAEQARRRGMGVTGHVPAFDSPERVILDGYQEITHLNQIVLGWVLPPGTDTRTAFRITGMARAADLDLSSAAVQNTVQFMASRNIAHDPTISIIEELLMSRAGTVSPGYVDYASHMPIGFRRGIMRTIVPIKTPQDDARYRQAFAKMLEALQLMQKSGIRILPGTDNPIGFSLHRELELYTMAGMTPAQALRAGTLGCEEYLGRAGQLGTIERGKLADFFLIAGDPTRDVRAIKTPRMVLKGGTVYFPAEIHEALGIQPFARPPAIRAVTE